MLLTYSYVMFWLGKRAGKTLEARRRQGISPEWANQVKAYLSRLLEPPADNADLDDMVVLPQRFKDDGRKLYAGAPGVAEERAKLRRQIG